MLNAENAKSLEEAVHKRLGLDSAPDKLTASIMQCAVRATIVTLQEYERMQETKDQ